MSIPPSVKKKIIKQYPGRSISQLAREHGISRRAVKQVIRKKQTAENKNRKKLFAAAVIALVLAAGGALYYIYGLAPAATSPGERNLLVITIDTCRADRLGCYGHGKARTPMIDSLAKNGVSMEKTYALQPITLPSHATIFTGLHPRNHGIHNNGIYKLPEEALTMAELLRDRGYETGAIISAFVLNRQFGLSQGFDHYDDSLSDDRKQLSDIAEMKASVVSDRAIKWINQKEDQKWFLWLHYFDPHANYNPPPRFRTENGHPYDGEIAYVDSELVRVFRALEQKNLRKKTVVILTSDHGESLGEHDEGSHGIFLYNAVMRVPLIFSLPGALPEEKTVPRVTSLLDVMPTALELLGIKPPASLQGRSLMPLLEGDADEWQATPPVMETMLPWEEFGWSPSSAIVKNGHKYIEAPIPELYDLKEDPHELVNIYEMNRGLAKAMARELKKKQNIYSQGGLAEDSKRSMDEKDRRQLASLGYMTEGDAGKVSKEAPDAKQMIKIKKQIDAAKILWEAGKRRRAIEQMRKALRKDPHNYKALVTLADWLRIRNNFMEARQRLERVIEEQPRPVEAYLKLALVYVDQRKLNEAQKSAEKALALEVKKSKSYRILGVVHLMKKDYDKAMDYFKKAIDLFPTYHQAYVGVAAVHEERKDYDKALDALNTALRIFPESEQYQRFITNLKKRMKAAESSASKDVGQ